jgi:hypothetical protein
MATLPLQLNSPSLFIEPMRTLAAMISIGRGRECTPYAFPRLTAWAQRHSLDVVLITTPLKGNRLPHFEKLSVPAAFPGYDRYVICDDDLLISAQAPEPPMPEKTCVGMVPDAVQENTTAPYVKWTGNTGMLVLGADAIDLCESAQEQGDTSDIWGIADQGALNRVAWQQNRVSARDPRWNFMPVIEYIDNEVSWNVWSTRRSTRMGYYARLLSGIPSRYRENVRSAWGLHLIRAPGKCAFFNRLLP